MNYPTHPSAPPPPPSLQWQDQQQQPSQPPSQHFAQQQQWQAAPTSFQTQLRAPSRNIGMIIGGVVLLLIALGAAVVFTINLHQYLTIEDRWASDSTLSHGSQWIVELIKQAAMKRMMIFGPVMAAFGLGGLALGGLGLRKK